jgi:iron complex outermembrane receptor protein
MINPRLLAGFGLLASAVLSGRVSAQGAAPAPAGANAPPSETSEPLQDVVVTAQFRREPVQDTPLAITALGSAQLEEQGLNRITDITNSAPNVVMKPSGSIYGPAATLFIRGVGQMDSSFAVDPGVGIYVDDVYRGITFGSLLDLLDLERVEILRGPQGTLAGKNTIGGAVKLYSKMPDGEGGGYFEATTGSFDRLDARGAGDFTLVPDALFMRASAVTRHRDGYLTRYDFNCAHPAGPVAPTSVGTNGDCRIGTEGGQDYTAGRVALRWLASDAVEVNVAADRLDDDSEPTATKLISLNSAAATTPGITDRSVFLTAPESYSSYSTYVTQPFTDPAVYAGRPGAGSHPTMIFPTDNRIRAWDVAGSVDVRLTQTLSLKSITGYQDTDGRYSTDNDTTPFGIGTGVFSMKYRQFTQELRLNGVLGEALNWTTGAYYYDGKGRLGGTNIINPGLASETVNGTDDTIPSKSKSGFAHVVWHITDRLNATSGVRYTRDEKSYSFRRTNLYVPGAATYTSASLIDGYAPPAYTGHRWDYRANLDFKLADHVLVYGQYSTGYRGGGINPRPFVIQQAVPFLPETLNAYEIGLKSDWFGRRLRINLATFMNDYHDMIFSNTAPTVVDGVVLSAANGTPVNAGDGRFKGVELELSARPIEGLAFDLNASYLDFELRRIGGAGVTIPNITLNNVAPYVTKWKVGAGVQYRIPLGTVGSITPRVGMAYQSSFFTNIDNNPATLTPGYTVYDARLAWRSTSEDWEVALAGTNLSNRFYYQNTFRGPGIQVVTGQPAPPREWSLSLRRNF